MARFRLAVLREKNMKEILFLWICLIICPAALAHEGHDKAFANKENMVATNQKVHIAAAGQAAIGLRSQAVKVARLEKFLELTGMVAPADNKVHYVTSPVGGTITSIDVQVNDSVRKGQKLATVYSADIASILTDLLDQRASLQTEITKAKAQAQNDVQLQSREVEHYAIDADRQKKLFAEGVSAQRTYLDAAHALDMAKSKLEGTKRQLSQNLDALNDRQKTITDATKRRLAIMGLPVAQVDEAIKSGSVEAKVPIISPADGTVYSRDVSNGESIQSSKKLLSIVMLSPIWITLNVNQEQLDQIKIGQEVSIKPPVGPNITGKISSVASIVDPVERTVHVRVIAENRKGSLRPQMFVSARIMTGKQAVSSIIVPQQAVIEDAGKQWVYVKYGDDFQVVAVSIGSQIGDLIEVKDGLYEGDQVVVVGAKQVRAQAMLRAGKEEAAPNDHDRKHDHKVSEGAEPKRDYVILGAVLIGGLVGGVLVGLFLSRLNSSTKNKNRDEEKTHE